MVSRGSPSFLDDAGIDVAITSISTPGVHTGDDAAARTLARRCNELSAELVRDRPDRFGGFACLPLPDVDGALAELAYALDVLGLDGVVLFSNSRGVYLGMRGWGRSSRNCNDVARSSSSTPTHHRTRARITLDCRTH